MPESPQTLEEEKPKIPTGRLLIKLTVLDDRNRPQVVSVWEPPTVRSESGEEIVIDPRGYGYIVTNDDKTKEIVWDLDRRILYEPDVQAYRGYRGGLTPKTARENEEREFLRRRKTKSPASHRR